MKSDDQSKSKNILLLVGILFMAFNLRLAISGIGPLIEDIRAATGLSNGLLGLLTSLPLIAFGLMSTLTPIFTRRFGIVGTLLGAMLLLTIGTAMRYIPWVPALYFGTFLAGVAIAFGNVLLPTLTKRNFESNSGLVTSLYSSMMAGSAGFAAGVSVPLADDLGLGWRGSLSFWAIFSLIAFFLWLPQLSRIKKSKPQGSYFASMKKLGTSTLAWQVALFMGLQSLVFYVIFAWLPAILQSRGYEAAYAGWMLSLSQVTGILGSLIIPIFAGKNKDQRRLVWCLIFLELIGLFGLLFPQLGMVPLWVSLIGFVLGGCFGLSLLLIVLRSKDADATTELSGMAQSIGYLVAGIGPIIFGAIFDLTGSWNYAFILLFVAVFLKLITGLGAARPL